MKVAVLSMDIEDWYHLEYFDHSACDRSQSLLDGIHVYRDFLARYGIHSSFFVLGELINPLKNVLFELAMDGHDVGVHGWDHTLPMKMTIDEFSRDLRRSKKELENIIQTLVQGYRAPCFSLNRDRLDQVHAVGFEYDSSRILFSMHPLYGSLDLDGYLKLSPNIYRNDTFFEFQVSSHPFVGRNFPVSGGGYIRIFPWILMRRLINSYLQQNELYVLYIHPFELSPQSSPNLPTGTRWSTRIRFKLGRSSVIGKLSALIDLLMANEFRFITFSMLRKELLAQQTKRA